MKKSWYYQNLHNNEKIIWIGKPKCNHLMATGEFWLIPVKFFLYTLIIASAAFRSNYIACFGMIIIGFYECGGYLAHKIYIRRKLIYIVTNQRIIILYNRKPYSVDYQSIDKLDKIIYSDGYGDILLNNRPYVWGRHFMLPIVWRELHDELVCVKQGEKLYQIIHDYRLTANRKNNMLCE